MVSKSLFLGQNITNFRCGWAVLFLLIQWGNPQETTNRNAKLQVASFEQLIKGTNSILCPIPAQACFCWCFWKQITAQPYTLSFVSGNN